MSSWYLSRTLWSRRRLFCLLSATSSRAAVSNLQVSDIYLPQTIKIQWTGGTAPYQVSRTLGGVTTVLGSTSSLYWLDSSGFTSGAACSFTVSDTTAPPANAVSINVTPFQVTASDAGTVDSRTLDNQTGAALNTPIPDPIFRDFQFKQFTYRGGLFAGLSGDHSRVGRTFLKFAIPAIPAGGGIWSTAANAYYTRSFQAGATTVGCQPALSGWASNTLRWTNAPALNPTAAPSTVTVSNGTPQWCHWLIDPCSLLAGSQSGSLSVALASTGESSSG